jgi:hypothetical protein
MMAHLPAAQQGKKPRAVVLHPHEKEAIPAGKKAPKPIDQDVRET